MRSRRGYTLIELMIYCSIATIGLSSAFLLWGAEEMSSRADQKVLRESAAISKTLVAMAEDARACVRAVPRHRGVGALFFFNDGSVAVWFDREGEPGAVHRKVVRPDGSASVDRVIARHIDRLGVDTEGRLVTAIAGSGDEERSLTVRRRR